MIFMRMPDHERDAAPLTRQALKRGVAVAIETAAQQKVFRGVAAQRELRGQHQVRAGGAGKFAVSEDLGGVPGKVADDTVDLGNRDLDDARHPASLASGSEPSRSVRLNRLYNRQP